LQYRVKLAAIAKDEAAYLPEWIHHHLYFGFDEIEIHVNNTTDNSNSVIKKIGEHYPVKMINADALFLASPSKFQISAYKKITQQARKDGFTHLMFLDIDEFWTPKNFNVNIKEFISSQPLSDVYLFNWCIHKDEELFSSCYKANIKVAKDKHLKYLVDLSASVKRYGAHNAVGGDLIYRLANGSTYNFEQDDDVRAQILPKAEIEDYYIIHRIYRSQLEYVSLLSRGRTHGAKLKDNRTGYYGVNDKTTCLVFNVETLNKYYDFYRLFLDKCDLNVELQKAQHFVEERYKKTLALFDHPLSIIDLTVLKRAFINITLEDVKKIVARLGKTGNGRNKYIDQIRDSALFFESIKEYKTALKLMLIAQELRPDGQVIKEKVKFLTAKYEK